ncbi:MAG: hypothetical protein ACR2H3_15580 [Acidimicrobiales bacterium]
MWSPRNRSPSAEEISASCAEALARHDEWDERLSQAPDKNLEEG